MTTRTSGDRGDSAGRPTNSLRAAPGVETGQLAAAPDKDARARRELPTPPEHAVLATGGEMGALIRAFDWAQTPIGPVESWSPALRMMVQFLLANRFPLLLWWGPQYVSIYNDPYRPVLGAKHPWALGQPVSTCWSEIWHILQPLIDAPFQGGPATWMDDLGLEINRHGFVEETHFTVAYSPVPDESVPGGIGGVLATVHEITEQVVGARRVVALRDLGARVGEAKTAEDACALAAATLAEHPADIPFALLYLLDPDRRRARLAGAAGVAAGGPASPPIIALDAGARVGSPWPLREAAREAVRTETVQVVEDLAGRLGAATPRGPWSDPPCRAVVVPMRSHLAHQPAGVLVVGISARLRLDASYRDFIDLAASQVATAIANARAHEDERRRAEALAELDRAKTAFFANVSHEFRTPLTLLLGPLEEAIGAAGEAAQRASLEVAHRNGLRLLRLVNSLLDFARLEAGRVRASFAPTDLPALTADLASTFRSAVERAGLRLTVETPPLPDGVTAYVDRAMWEQIVLNLLSNAFKFTFAGEIAVGLRAAPDGRALALAVRDTGTGIPAAEVPRLFERFHRVQGARARTHEGTGIGLALVQELVRLHGGTIAVASEEGQGTTVTVTIPAGRAHVPPGQRGAARDRAQAPPDAAAFVEEALSWLPDEAGGLGGQEGPPGVDEGAPPVAPPTGGRVLLADDNADMRDYVARLLRGRYAVEAVGDGAAALAAALTRPPDLVLADVMMPRLDGFGLLRALRADPRTVAVPIILLSARAGEEARVEGLDAGADDYLIKPFSARELRARVGAQLALARARAEVARRERAARTEAEAGWARLRLALEAARMAAWEWDVTAGAITATENFPAIYGGPASALAAPGLALVHPEDRARHRAVVERAVAGGEGYHAEFRIIRPDTGATVWLDERAGVLRGPDGAARALVGLTLDITARRQAEEALRRSEQRYRVLFEHASDPIVIGTEAGTLLDANAQACQLLGYTREEFVRLRVADVFLTTPERQAATVAALRGGATLRVQSVLRRKDGTPVPVEIVARTLEDGRVLAIARDISERLRAEAEREAQGARILQAQEEERRRIARELHDVTAQDLFAQSLLLKRLARPGARLDREGRETLAEVRALGAQALRDLRTQSYLLHPPLLDELGLAVALEWLVEGFARRSGIAVELVVDAAVGRLPGAVELALFRVAQEGLGNVHRHAGSATARVALAREGDAVILRVEDHGHGLPRTDGGDDTPAPTGVGLAGMRERLRPLGGRLALASSDQGTTLSAVVPLPHETAR